MLDAKFGGDDEKAKMIKLMIVDAPTYKKTDRIGVSNFFPPFHTLSYLFAADSVIACSIRNESEVNFTYLSLLI
jgi:hypothetical protein